jgi:hypothetical protein
MVKKFAFRCPESPVGVTNAFIQDAEVFSLLKARAAAAALFYPS